MAHRASLEHILKEVGLCFSSSVYNKELFIFILELARQTLAIFCSILTGMALELKLFYIDTWILGVKDPGGGLLPAVEGHSLE